MREIRPQAEQGIVWRNPKSIFKYNGWPSVCRDERGVLYATASSFRIQHVDPVGKNAMFVSFNDGKTWTRPRHRRCQPRRRKNDHFLVQPSL